MVAVRERIEGAVFGLAFGDGIAEPSATNRLGILAPKRIMRMRLLSEYADQKKQTTRPIPYTHAQAGSLLNPSPSDDCEWFAFVVKYILSNKSSLNAWQELSRENENIRARTGTKIALNNLANGLLPPNSGHDNPHYFDDIALARAGAIALIHFNNSAEMLQRIEDDITITHSEDGLYCAISFAKFLAAILGGQSKAQAISDALNSLPKDSWSERLVTQALQISKGINNDFERAIALEEKFIEKIYAYPISAPETLGLLLAHFENTDTPERLINSALLHKRKLDSLPPLAGLLSGIFYGASWLPQASKAPNIYLDGVCIPNLKGVTLRELADSIFASQR
jgi:ADP-ribosylglycohydrolase